MPWITKNEFGQIIDICPAFPHNDAAYEVADDHPEVVSRQLSGLKRARLDEVRAVYEAKLAKGVQYPAGSGTFLQLDQDAQGDIDSVGQSARWVKIGVGEWPSDFAWRMGDDSYLPLPTADAMIALGLAAQDAVLSMKKAKWAHEDAIAGLKTREAITSYNINLGWPL